MWFDGSLRFRGPLGRIFARFAAFFRTLSALVTVSMVPLYML